MHDILAFLYQYGSAIEPLARSAEPVEQTAVIEAP